MGEVAPFLPFFVVFAFLSLIYLTVPALDVLSPFYSAASSAAYYSLTPNLLNNPVLLFSLVSNVLVFDLVSVPTP